MKIEKMTLAVGILSICLLGCSSRRVLLIKDNLDVKNRNITSFNNVTNTLVLNRKIGDGIAILKDLRFKEGTIELELKGENNPGKSFVGFAFNIQNDSTYEAIYFRPFNFRSQEQKRRKHSVQYIYHPKHTWIFLRTNFEGEFEGDYPRRPLPNNWFNVKIEIDNQKVHVYDKKTNTVLLSITRLTKQVSDKIGLWVGYNSKGEFRNLKIAN